MMAHDVPTLDQLTDWMREQLGVSLERHPSEVVPLAAIGIINSAWRNTSVENLHAGDHPSGGFPDTDMMRYNIATFRAISAHVSARRVDWGALRDLLADPDRPLPGGLTVGQLTGEELTDLLGDSAAALHALERIERDHGIAFVLTFLALRGGIECNGWYGTPWWPDVVEALLELLADPGSDAWTYDDGSRPEPASVADRTELAACLLHHPERLDDDAIWWCHGHGLVFRAPFRGYTRWRRRRDTAWRDPSPWLSGDA